MKFTSAIAASILSLVSLSSADQISVATIYRYVDATATVYQNYCPCAATASNGLTSPTGTSSSGTSGSAVQPAYVNNNAGSNNIGSNAGSGSGAVSPNGAVTTVYSTVYVQYVTSTQLSYYTTTVYPAAGSTVTQVITNTATVTVPVTVTSTITATITPSGGANVAPGQQSATSARYSNSTTTALDSGNGVAPIGQTASVTMTFSTQLTDSAVSTTSTAAVTDSASAPFSSTTSGASTSTAQVGGGGVDGQANSAASSSTSSSAPASTTTDPSSTTLSASSTSTSAAPSSSTTDAVSSTSSAASSTSTAASTSSADPSSSTTSTSSTDSSSSTTAAPIGSSTSSATTSTTSLFTASSSSSSAPTPQYTLNLQVAAFGQDPITGVTYTNSLWLNTTSGLPSVYYNPPGDTTEPSTNVQFVFGDEANDNEIFWQGQRFAYDAALLATGTTVVLAAGTTTLNTNFNDDHATNPNFSIQDVTFYFYPYTNPALQVIYTQDRDAVLGADIAAGLCYTVTEINSIPAAGTTGYPASTQS